MSDWITLAEAFNFMVASEGDVALVERLLLPAFWDGKISAIGRRAFIDDHLKNDVPLPTKKEWDGWPEINPVLFDWEKSRATSPRAFTRSSPAQKARNHPRVEYYRVEVSALELHSFWPDLKMDVSPQDIAKKAMSGLVGRPTSKHLIRAELNRRAASGERHPTKQAWSEELHRWFEGAYGPDYPEASAKTILNSFRDQFGDLLSPGAPRRPK